MFFSAFFASRNERFFGLLSRRGLFEEEVGDDDAVLRLRDAYGAGAQGEEVMRGVYLVES